MSEPASKTGPMAPVKNTIESTKRVGPPSFDMRVEIVHICDHFQLEKLIKKYKDQKLDILQIDYMDMGISKGLRVIPMELLSPLTNMKQVDSLYYHVSLFRL